MDDEKNENQSKRPAKPGRLEGYWRRMTNSVLIVASASILGASSTYAITKANDAEQRTEQVATNVRRTNDELSQLKTSFALLQDKIDEHHTHAHGIPCVCTDMSVQPPRQVQPALLGDCTAQMIADLRRLFKPSVMCREP